MRIRKIRAEGREGSPSGSSRVATTKTQALSIQMNPSAPACPWPRQGHTYDGQYAEDRGVLRAAVVWLQDLLKEGDLPAEVQDVVLFSDGPGSGQEEENHGWANLWRHQGLRF